MVKILKPILMVFIKSKAMAKQTDNKLDDQANRFIETKMFP